MRLVGQEPVLFSGTVEDNILYGIPEDERNTLPPHERQQRVRAVMQFVVVLVVGHRFW